MGGGAHWSVAHAGAVVKFLFGLTEVMHVTFAQNVDSSLPSVRTVVGTVRTLIETVLGRSLRIQHCIRGAGVNRSRNQP